MKDCIFCNDRGCKDCLQETCLEHDTCKVHLQVVKRREVYFWR